MFIGTIIAKLHNYPNTKWNWCDSLENPYHLHFASIQVQIEIILLHKRKHMNNNKAPTKICKQI